MAQVSYIKAFSLLFCKSTQKLKHFCLQNRFKNLSNSVPSLTKNRGWQSCFYNRKFIVQWKWRSFQSTICFILLRSEQIILSVSFFSSFKSIWCWWKPGVSPTPKLMGFTAPTPPPRPRQVFKGHVPEHVVLCLLICLSISHTLLLFLSPPLPLPSHLLGFPSEPNFPYSFSCSLRLTPNWHFISSQIFKSGI